VISNSVSGGSSLSVQTNTDVRPAEVTQPPSAVVPPADTGPARTMQWGPGAVQIPEHTGPRAAIADLINMHGSFAAAAEASSTEPDEETEETPPLPMEAVDPSDAQYQQYLARYVQAMAPPTRAALQTEAKAYLDEQTTANESLVRGHHAWRREGRPEPTMPGGAANNELAVTINRLVQTETFKKRYEISPLVRHRSEVEPLPLLSEEERFTVARKALASLETRWQRDGVRNDGIALALLGKTQDEWFTELKGQLAGKTMAQAKVIIKASCEAAVSDLGPVPKRAFAAALMDALDPLLNLLPDAQQQQFVWADDTHISLRIGYQALRAADIPVESADEVNAAAHTIDSELLSHNMASLAVECKARELARLSGDMPPHGLSDDVAVDSALARFNARPSAQKEQQLVAMRAAMSEPPPSLREIAREYGRQYISGRDDVMVNLTDRSAGNGVLTEYGPRHLLDAFTSRAATSQRGQDDDSKTFRMNDIILEIDSHLGKVGDKVWFSAETLQQEYDKQIDEYYERVERGVMAQLDVLIGSHRQLDSILVPRATMLRTGEVKSPDNSMIVTLRSQEAQAAQAYKLHFVAGRGAVLTPMRVSEQDVSDFGLDTPEKRARHYVGKKPERFFSRAPQQSLLTATINFDRSTGSPEELRRKAFQLIGWQQKIEAARAEAKRSLQTDNPAIAALPLFGCATAISEAFRDRRPVNPEYDATLVEPAPPAPAPAPAPAPTPPTPTPTPTPTPAPPSRGTNPYQTDPFEVGVACFNDMFQLGVAFGGAAKLAGTAGARAARSMLNSRTYKTAKQVIVYRDLLKSGTNEFRQRLSILGNSPSKVNSVVTKLNSARYGHTIRNYSDAQEMATLSRTHTTDGSTLKPGALPAGSLVNGNDGRRYLRAAGGQAGGIFLHTDVNNQRSFVRDIGTPEQPYYAAVDLRTRKIKPEALAFRGAQPHGTATIDGKETRFYRRNGETLVADGGRLRPPTAREAKDLPPITPRQAPVFYARRPRPEQAWVDEFASSPDKVQAFEQALASSERPIVQFPPSARGDMNAYKYTAFLNDRTRPLTVFEYYKNPTARSEQEAFNKNINVIKQHIRSLGDKFVEGRDYIFGIKKDIDRYKATAGPARTRHYQQYDSIMTNLDVRRSVHDMFKAKLDSEAPIKTYLAKKLPSAGTQPGTPENKLLMVNINKREPQALWNPREYRHTTPDDSIMRGLIDQVYDAHKLNKGKDKLDLAFVGSGFTAQEKSNWAAYATQKGVTVHFFNDMVDEGLDRNQQRAALFGLTNRYKSTTYFGHQSGVNEDAQLLARTNVYSLSEYLGLGQVGTSRIEARPQFDTVRTNDLGSAMSARSRGNFYNLRNSEFLTTEGILAGVQIKANLTLKTHPSLNELWGELIRQDPDMMKPEKRVQATDKLLKTILKHAGQVTEEMTDEMISRKIGAQAMLDYKNAVDVIVRRMQTGDPRPSPAAMQYFRNAMEQELIRHDSTDPITRHQEKTTAHNAGLQPYTVGNNQLVHRATTENHDNYLEGVIPAE